MSRAIASHNPFTRISSYSSSFSIVSFHPSFAQLQLCSTSSNVHLLPRLLLAALILFLLFFPAFAQSLALSIAVYKQYLGVSFQTMLHHRLEMRDRTGNLESFFPFLCLRPSIMQGWTSSYSCFLPSQIKDIARETRIESLSQLRERGSMGLSASHKREGKGGIPFSRLETLRILPSPKCLAAMTEQHCILKKKKKDPGR